MTTTAFDEHERAHWAGRAAAYQGSFAALCAHPAGALLDAAGVVAGDRLLDVGTGTGTVAALACSRGARVVAVDAEPSMLELARGRAPAAEFHHTALPELPFPGGAFDAAVANFVLNHVGDPAAAVRELCRVVRPGGRIAVTIWPHPAPPAQRLWTTIFEAAGVERPTDLPRVAPDRDFPRTRDGLAGLLDQPGLTGVRCDILTWTHHTDAESWWSGPANGLGLPGVLMGRQDPATVGRIRDQYDRHTTGYRDAQGRLALPTAALLASGCVADRQDQLRGGRVEWRGAVHGDPESA
ncbi:class I SAM-dependent methyltransferase [Actinoplanes sp. NEAU-A12]|uniref:Class I SAM-dependent methyltransferase n=1 Tax=Actinoplanes sandaracinus TaxID=3045177 RepID=A0ABT6WGP2_9ACTN|nr:class I SAM-dependent methyltransferase [Actinoplanes sandaracinus]MDI6098870.1 class I SAM-dependent methyltransferase [Actinoplanes sandaracinus]